MRRLLLVVLLLTVAACNRPHPHPHPTPTPTPPAPAPGGLRQVHSPGHVVDDMHLSSGQCHATGTDPKTARPDPACTPGAIDPAVTQANIGQTICVKGWTATVRPPVSETGPAKTASMADYGVTDPATHELDHFIPLELGGANSTSNLWPEPGASPNGKDAVEGRAKGMVCSGRMSLADAQRLIAQDWTSFPGSG